MPALLSDLKSLDKKLDKAEKRFNKILEKRYSDLESTALRQVSTYKKNKDFIIQTSKTQGLEKDLKSHFKEIESISAGHARRELLNLARTNEEKEKIKKLSPDKLNKSDQVYAQKLAKKQVEDFENKLKDKLNEAIKADPKIKTEELKKIIKDETLSFKNTRITATSETEANRVSNETKARLYKKMGINAVRFTAVLDNRTSQVCIGLNGKVFQVGSSDMMEHQPPRHVHCRSYFVAMAN